MAILAPSIFASDYIHLKRQLGVMREKGVKQIHLDIMDGNFVPGLSFGPEFVSNIRPYSDLFFDVHLMVLEPERFIKDFAVAGADGITVHSENFRNESEAEQILDEIHSFGKKAGIALSPVTGALTVTAGMWERMDLIRLMTVEPGQKGQHFMPGSLDKIAEVHKIVRDLEKAQGRHISIGVDGDITPDNLEGVLRAGADSIVVGKELFKGDLKHNLDKFCNLLQSIGAGKKIDAFSGKENVCGT